MATIFEIQASFIGIGKTTFAKKFKFAFADDCINLVESLSDYWYGGTRYFLSPNSETEALFKAYLVLENSACAVSEALSKNKIVVSSRSALVSSIQFLPFEPCAKQIEAMVDFYQARLEHMGIKKVIILDFGSSILLDPKYIEAGYNRMCKRARPYELKFFHSFEKYQKFFYLAEQKKHVMLKELQKRTHFFQYKTLNFLDFGVENYDKVLNCIQECLFTKIDSF